MLISVMVNVWVKRGSMRLESKPIPSCGEYQYFRSTVIALSFPKTPAL